MALLILEGMMSTEVPTMAAIWSQHSSCSTAWCSLKVFRAINTTLVSFAAELLLQSQHPDDYISAVSVLHSLVIKNKERSDAAIDQICASEKLVCRLVRMLRSSENLVSIPQSQRIEIDKQTKNDLDADIKAHIAQNCREA